MENALPLEWMHFLVGTVPGTLPTPCASGATIDILNYFVLVSLPADASGTCEIVVQIPAYFAGFTFLVQAGLIKSCDTTNVVTVAF